MPSKPTPNFDLDAVMAEESKGKKQYTFQFDGETYKLPPVMDLRSVAAISGGRLDDGLRQLLGQEQYDRMNASEAVFTLAALEALFDDYIRWTGGEELTVGKSSASTLRSVRTARR